MIGHINVDALALMFDGHTTYGGRFDRTNVSCLEKGGMCDLFAYASREPELAEAILELEGLADWRPLEGGLTPSLTSELGILALDKVGHLSDRFTDISEALLEAAAILRDGWRPKWWRR